MLYGQAAFQAIAAGGAMGFIPVFLVRLAAPAWLVGLHSSLPALLMTVAVLPVGSLMQRRDVIKATIWGRLGFRGTVGALSLLPWLPASLAPFVLVGLRSLMALPSAIVNVGTTTILGHVSEPKSRAKLISNRLAIQRSLMAVSGFCAGQWLDSAPYPINYQVLFLTAIGAAVGSMYMTSRVKLPKGAYEEQRRTRALEFREIIPVVVGVAAFRRYAIASVAFRLGAFLPLALFPIYRVRVLGSSDAWIGTLMTVQRLVQMVVFFALGRLLARRWLRRSLWLSCLGMALFPLTTLMAAEPVGLIVPALVSGVMAPGMSVFLTNTLMHVSPEDQRPVFAAANTFVVQVTRFVGPVLGTLIASVVDIRVALLVAAIARGMGAVMFWRLGVGREA
jgi:MFS family permease